MKTSCVTADLAGQAGCINSAYGMGEVAEALCDLKTRASMGTEFNVCAKSRMLLHGMPCLSAPWSSRSASLLRTQDSVSQTKEIFAEVASAGGSPTP